jgi:PIN domain nuclease of toxin-antitoxin system
MLVAQALIERMPLLTADKRFSAYGVEVLSI